MWNFRFVFASLIVVLMGVASSAAEQKGSGSWKNFMSLTFESLSKSEMEELTPFIVKLVSEIDDECPIALTTFSNLKGINVYEDDVEIFLGCYGPLECFFFDFNEEKKDGVLPEIFSKEETYKRILCTMVDDDEPLLNIINYVEFFLKKGKTVTIDLIENSYDDNDSKESCKGIRAMLYPDGSLGDIEIKDYSIINDMSIMDPDEVYSAVLADGIQASDYEPDYFYEDYDIRVYSAVEERAVFPGGEDALMEWISKHINYPKKAAKNGIQGRVIVKFVVEKDGSISNGQVVKGVDQSLDQESLRVIKEMPRWKPAKIGGRPVRSYFNMPVTFKLPSDSIGDK